MEIFLEVVKLLSPSIIVFFTAYFLIKRLLDSQERKLKIEIRRENAKSIIPQRLQAYERLILLMERLEPNNLILRTHKKNTSARSYQSELIQTVRQEYEHNLSQQIYVSNASWSLVKQAKEESIKLINISAARLKEDAKSIDLSKYMIEMASQMERLPNEVAIDYLKREARKMF